MYQLISIAVPLLTTPYLSRVLHAEGIGIYTFAYTIAYYFITIAMLGMNNYGNRTIASDKELLETYSYKFWSIYYLQLFVSSIVFIVYIIYSFIFNQSTLSKIFSIFVFSSILDINWFFWGLEKFKITVTRNVLIKLSSTVLIFLLVKGDNDIWIYGLITSLTTLLSQIILWYYLFKSIPFVRVKYKDTICHLKPTLILFIPVVAVSIYKIIDRIMLGLLSNDTELGYFENSEKIIQIPIAFVVALGIVMLPRMTSIITKNDKDKEIIYLKTSTNFAILLSVFLCCLIMSLSKIFVPWFYGSGFEKCVGLYLVLLPSCVFLALSNVVRTQYLIPRKLDNIYVKAVLFGAIVNVGLNLMLIPKFASLGASVSTLVTEIFVCVYQLFLIKNKSLFLNSIKNNFHIIIFLIINGYIIYILNMHLSLFIQLLLKSIIYVSLFVLYLSSIAIYNCHSQCKALTVKNIINQYRAIIHM